MRDSKMGCGITKRKVDASVDLNLQASGNPHYDQLFEGVEEQIRSVLEGRQKLKAAYVAFQKEVGTYKQFKKPTFYDSLMAMLFCLSASGEGDLESVGFEYLPGPPYITVNLSLLYPEHRKILPAWVHLITIATTLPTELAPCKDHFELAIAETSSTSYLDFPETEAGITTLDPLNSPKVARTVTANHEKLLHVPTLLGEVVDLAREITDTMGHMREILVKAGGVIVAIGRQAYIDQRLLPCEIVGRYWPSTKAREA